MRFWGVMALLIALSGCSSNSEKEENTKKADLVKFKRTLDVDRLWTTGTGEGDGREYLRLVPAIVADTAYVPNAEGHVKAVLIKSGKRKWQVKTGHKLSGGVGAYFGTVVFGTIDGKVVALDAETGEERWVANVSSEVLAAPAVNASVVVVQTIDARVFTFNTKTGEKLWSYDHLTPVLSIRGTASPVIEGSEVICAFDNGQLVSFSLADGSRTWEARLSQPKGKTDLERIVDIDGSPIVAGQLVFSGGVQGNIMAFARANGRPIWRNPLSTYHGLALGGTRLFTTTENGTVKAYNISNGEVAWETEVLLNRGLGAPAIVDDYLVTIDEDGYLHVLNQSDGQYVHRFKPSGDGFNAPVQSYLGKLYVLSNNGKLSAYALSSR